MTILQTIASLALLGFGALAALMNFGIIVQQFRGRRSPSMMPLLGGIALFTGAALYPGGALRHWAALGLFVDIGCVPMFVIGMFNIAYDKWKFAAGRRLLSLAYDAPACSGVLHLFPENDCIRTWRAKHGQSWGSMLMTIEVFVPGSRIELSIEEARITIDFKDEHWVLLSESGWKDMDQSLEGSVLTDVTDRT